MKYLSRRKFMVQSAIAFAAVGTLGFSQSLFAAVPANVTTALTDSAADTITVAGLVLVIIVGIMTFRYIRRAL